MPIDPEHLQWIPSGQALGRVVRMFAGRIAAESVYAMRHSSVIDLNRYLTPMVQASVPLLSRYWLQGQKIAKRRIAEARKPKRSKALGDTGPLDMRLTEYDPFNVLLPGVLAAVTNQAFAFAQSTLQTIQGDIATAIRDIRREISEGLGLGDTLLSITANVQRIIADPVRAQRIAASEASRSMHAGQVAEARSAGIEKMRWLTSADACDRCTALDGIEVPIGQAFYVDKKGGPYSVVSHPPLHPNCMCAIVEVL